MVNVYRLSFTVYRLLFTEDEGFRLLWSQELTAAALLHSFRFRFWLLDNSKQKRGYPLIYIDYEDLYLLFYCFFHLLLVLRFLLVY